MRLGQKPKPKRRQIKNFLRTLAPDFCWCSVKDLYLMYELIDEDIDLSSFSGVVSQSIKEGILIKRVTYVPIAKNNERRKKMEVLRVT